MPYLKNSKVERAGLTARYWSNETSKIMVFSDQQKMKIDFDMASKGGGTTQVRTTISPKDFSAIVSQMMASDKTEALKAMTAAIAEHHS